MDGIFMRTEFDWIIIGGGINGAALARLAALQGIKVGLFEAGDYGQGASSATSKLVHGGIRYLEHFNFGLVRESVRERARLLRAAPHLVEERRFLFPVGLPGGRMRWSIKAAMTLYDSLAGKLGLEPHRYLSRDSVKEMEPRFLPGNPCAAYAYSDCSMDDSRLVMENVIDAWSLGAETHNYHRFLGIEDAGRFPDGERILEVTVLDRRTLKEKVFRCRKLALTLGPFTDQVVSEQFRDAGKQLRLSQGAHLVVENLPSQSCFILPVPGTGRYFFVLPWKKYHLIGTTEVEISGSPPEISVPFDAEVAELRSLTDRYFPGLELRVICAFAGIRPLAGGGGSAGATAAVSREHQFKEISPGVYSVVGGKYTTHRALAEAYWRHISGHKPKLTSEARPLPGAWRDAAEKQAVRSSLLAQPFADDALTATWMGRYGRRALELAEFVSSRPEYSERLSSFEPLLVGEVIFALEREQARCPLDFFRRRTDLFFSPEGGMDCFSKVEDLFRKKVEGYDFLAPHVDYPAFLKGNRHRAAT